MAISLAARDPVAGGESPPLYQSPEWKLHARALEINIPLSRKILGWSLRCQPTPHYLASHRAWQSWITLGVGLLATLLVGGSLHSLSGRSLAVERQVVERTAALGARSHRA